MRPIKFRTWDTERKEWVLSIPPEEYMLDEDCWDDSNDPEDLMLYPANPLPTFAGRLIHQQFTGLKDSKGTEIYEGDIIKALSSDDKHLCKIVWVDNDARYGAEALPMKDFKGHLCTSYTMGCSNWEVVGNIFENSDLLKD